MASHSSPLAWEIPWTEEPGGLQSVASLRVRPSDFIHTASSYRDTSHIRLGSTLMISFYINLLFKGPDSKYNHILRSWSLGLQQRN